MGWAVGEMGTILHTSDGGDNWKMQQGGTTASLFSVAFITPQHGFAVGGGIILHTDNGGESWTRQISPVRNLEFIALPPTR
jgi:photosystem II stability/assembly factor-like uncharacterized protein